MTELAAPPIPAAATIGPRPTGLDIAEAIVAEVRAHRGDPAARHFSLGAATDDDRAALVHELWSDLASAGPLWSNIRLHHEGRDLHPSRFMTAHLGDGLVVQSYVDARAVSRYVDDGATMIYNHLHEASPAVRRIQERLEYDLGARVWIQAYVTKAGRTAFGLHRDDHNFVVLQLVGPKVWQVESASDTPTERVLRPGDGAFLRAETEHAVSGLGELSLHLTIALDWLVATEAQPGSEMKADLLETHRTALRIGSFLPVAVDPTSVSGPLTFRSSSRIRPTLSDDGGRVVLQCASGRFSCGAHLRPLLEHVVGGYELDVQGLVDATGSDRATVEAFLVFGVTKGFLLCG